ncbi:MAG: MFS transporter, partial [Proteobacteria bacterium]
MSRKSLIGLDALNLFLADVRDGIGPYLAIFLMASYQWDAASIGIAMSSMGIATMIAQTPAGAFIDRTKHKKLVMAVASTAVAASCISMTIFVTLPMIVFAQVITGIAAAFLAPGLASITLGLVGRSQLSKRTGRNEAFNHAGNVVAAAGAGLLGHYVAREWIFYLVAAMALFSMLSVTFIQDDDIDHAVARGCDKDDDTETKFGEGTASYLELLKDKKLLLFAFTMLLFHFANAPMLPLVGQLLSQGKATGASLLMSACIIIAQLVMIPTALVAGRLSQSIGRRPVMLVALIVLPLRGFLYTLSKDPYYLVGVQALDGIGAGIFGVTSVLMIADLTKGTGRYNIAAGALATAVGLGASVSTIVSGYVVVKLGYVAAFNMLGVIALAAAAMFWFLVPETSRQTK